MSLPTKQRIKFRFGLDLPLNHITVRMNGNDQGCFWIPRSRVYPIMIWSAWSGLVNNMITAQKIAHWTQQMIMRSNRNAVCSSYRRAKMISGSQSECKHCPKRGSGDKYLKMCRKRRRHMLNMRLTLNVILPSSTQRRAVLPYNTVSWLRCLLNSWFCWFSLFEREFFRERS